MEDTVNEALELCNSAGYKVLHILRQRYMRQPTYGIGKESLEKLKEIAEKLDPDVIIYDEMLKPSQNYNLASHLHRNILDREALILEIFEARASSAESKLQVKLAQMRYEMSRAKEKVRLARMGEQPGFMGIGRFEVDTYYNDIRHRMNSVKSKLEKSHRQRQLHRSGRERLGWSIVSLAGYTSAGKTTLFNMLTGEQNKQDAKLFTTLTTTTRRAKLGGEAILVSDTVGFISRLPTYMIRAFHSTLEEMVYADVILLVVDAGEETKQMVKKYKSCQLALAEIGVECDKVLTVLNKSDLAHTSADIAAKELGLDLGNRWVAISAKKGTNCKRLQEMVAKMTEVKRWS
ncbi:MAG: GTPase [Cenarchaeum symbiont of Oopsacas minuta]|nr:GTPase [Cenarchaeum symbiont of Oopsacas minuta]